MTTIQTLQTRTPSTEQYGRALAQAYRLFRVPDPSFAVAQELNIDAKILLDAGMNHALTFRWLLIAGTTHTVQPAKNATPSEVLRASIENEAIGYIKQLPDGLRNLARADLSGARYGFPRWKMQEMNVGGKVMKWAVPTSIADMDKNQFRLVTNVMQGYGGQRSPERGQAANRVRVSAQGFDVHANDWLDIKEPWRYLKHTFQDSQEYYGWGRGLRDALFFIWYAKSQLLVSMTEAADRFGTGYVDVGIDGLRDADTKLPNPTVVAEWLDVIRRMREAGAFVRDKDDELKMLETTGTGWKLMTDLWNLLSGDADRLILGAKLPTGGGSDDVGSLARAEVEKDSTTAIINACRSSLEETMTDDLLGAFGRLNVRNFAALGLAAARCGRFTIGDEEETVEEIPASERVTQALANGMPVLRTEAYDAYKLTVPQQGDEVVEGQKSEPPVMPPGFGGGLPGGGSPAPPGGFQDALDVEDMKRGPGRVDVRTWEQKFDEFKAQGPAQMEFALDAE